MTTSRYPDVPPEVACPHCGGYVRGHQWIGTDRCSVDHVEWDGYVPEPPRVLNPEAIGDPSQTPVVKLW